MKEAIRIIRDELKRLAVEKREAKRWSAGWHRVDGAQCVLQAILRTMEESMPIR